MTDRDRHNRLVDLDCKVIHETELAYRIGDVGEDDEPIWLPKSQCQYDESDGTMTMPEWLAIEKGLI